MQVHVELCVIPIGAGVSLGDQIAACQEVLEAHGFAPELHAWGTNLEGDWDTVFAAVKACHERLHADGNVRLFTSLKVGTRTDRSQSLADKVTSVRDKRG